MIYIILVLLLIVCIVWRWWWPIRLGYISSRIAEKLPPLVFSWGLPNNLKQKKLWGGEFFWADIVAYILARRKSRFLVSREDRGCFLEISSDEPISRTSWWTNSSYYLIMVLCSGYSLFYSLFYDLKTCIRIKDIQEKTNRHYLIEVSITPSLENDSTCNTSLWISSNKSIQMFRKDLIMFFKARSSN